MFGVIPSIFPGIDHEFTISKFSREKHGELQDPCVHEEKNMPGRSLMISPVVPHEEDILLIQ